MKKLLAVSVILISALTVLIWVGIVDASIPVLRVTQLVTDYSGGTVQVDGGKVVEIVSRTPLVFTICPDGDPSLLVRVESPRFAPESLREDSKVSIRGTYDSARGVFQAYRVSTKCPSKYEAVSTASQDPGAQGDRAGGAPGDSTKWKS